MTSLKNVGLGSKVMMKKQHPCGENKWIIVRYGADVKIRCLKCDRIILLPRNKFLSNLKEILSE